MHPTVILLCGRSFSGKSTVARALAAALPGELVSLDELNAERGLDGGQGIPIAQWAHTHDLAHQRVAATLAAGRTAVVDDTSSPRFLRDRWRETADRAGAGLVLVYLDTDVATIRSRQRANRAEPSRPDVTDEVMAEHLDSFQRPDADEDAVLVSGNPPDLAAAVAAVRAAAS